MTPSLAMTVRAPAVCGLILLLLLLGACSFEGQDAYDAGVQLFQKQELQAAEEKFLTAIEQNREFSEAYLNLGSVYLKQKKLAQAQEYTQKAINQLEANQKIRIPGSTWKKMCSFGYNNLGSIAAQRAFQAEDTDNPQQARQHRQQSLKYYQKALEYDPKNDMAQKNIRLVQRQEQQQEQQQSAQPRSGIPAGSARQ